MIERIDTFSLRGRSDDLNGLFFYRTIFLPTPTVTATTSISTFSIGFLRVEDRYQMGFIGSSIRKAGFSPAPGRSDDIPVDDDWNRNGVTIEKCTYVTFQLAVSMAEAIALCTLAIHDGTGKSVVKAAAKPAKLRPQALIVDRKTGLVRTVHYLSAVEGARLPSERFLAQRIKKCAADGLKVEPRAIEVAFHDDPDYRFEPETTFDRKTSRVRS